MTAMKTYGSPSTSWTPCYTQHKPLKVLNGTISGGNCLHSPHGLDVYVGLDQSMAHRQSWPWEEQVMQAVHFPIKDLEIPKNPDDFKKLIDWLCQQLEAGKSVHVGCMGGHGRTGLVLAALLAQANGDTDAITTLRNTYCDKAVETKEQINFLHQHYGIKKVEVHKAPSFFSEYYGNDWDDEDGHYIGQLVGSGNQSVRQSHVRTFKPVIGSRTIWSPEVAPNTHTPS